MHKDREREHARPGRMRRETAEEKRRKNKGAPSHELTRARHLYEEAGQRQRDNQRERERGRDTREQH